MPTIEELQEKLLLQTKENERLKAEKEALELEKGKLVARVEVLREANSELLRDKPLTNEKPKKTKREEKDEEDEETFIALENFADYAEELQSKK